MDKELEQMTDERDAALLELDKLRAAKEDYFDKWCVSNDLRDQWERQAFELGAQLATVKASRDTLAQREQEGRAREANLRGELDGLRVQYDRQSVKMAEALRQNQAMARELEAKAEDGKLIDWLEASGLDLMTSGQKWVVMQQRMETATKPSIRQAIRAAMKGAK